jgi:ATP-dependent DNA helicase RecQ
MRIHEVARERLGLRRMRPGQDEAIAHLASGRDALVVMPTGHGKSAVYQVAGLLLEGPTVVVSPLIALQKDQVEGLNARDAGGAAQLNSLLRPGEREATFAALARGEIEFIFLAPEQFNRRDALQKLKARKPSLFVVDEAHCISEWGHSFRPEYLRLGSVIEALGRPVTLALTATASPDVRDEIVERLGLRDPFVCVRGFDRPNISLAVQEFETDAGKRRALLDAVSEADRPGIVYVATQKRAEEVSNELGQRGESSVYYHGGLAGGERDQVQDAFMTDHDAEVIVATSAFGMGVDKADVRFVFHHDVSDSLDAYSPEIGRAGRDRRPARAVLFFRPEDLSLRRFFAGTGQVQRDEVLRVAEAIRKLRRTKQDAIKEATGLSDAKLSASITGLADVGAIQLLPAGEIRTVRGIDLLAAAEEAAARRERRKQHERARVEMMRAYAESRECRRKFLLNYFGEAFEPPCGNCDNCISGRAGQLKPRRSRPFPVKSFVVHPQWGRGMVLRYMGSRIVVIFDEVGEKALSLPVVLRSRLLRLLM